VQRYLVSKQQKIRKKLDQEDRQTTGIRKKKKSPMKLICLKSLNSGHAQPVHAPTKTQRKQLAAKRDTKETLVNPYAEVTMAKGEPETMS
jgi:hypothetical protein